MTVNDTLANTTRAAHDVGLAAWLGGAMFGKFAHNPSLKKIASHNERGSVTNAAWNGYNPINALGLGAAAIGWGAARATEANGDNLSGTELRPLPRQGRADGRRGHHRRGQRAAGRAPRPPGARRRGARRDRHQAGGRDPRQGGEDPAQPRPPRHAQHRRRRRARRRQRRHRPDRPQPSAQAAHARRGSPRPTARARCGSPPPSPPPAPRSTRLAAGSPEAMATETTKSKGVSLAKGPVLIVGLAMIAFGILAADQRRPRLHGQRRRAAPSAARSSSASRSTAGAACCSSAPARCWCSALRCTGAPRACRCSSASA